MGFKTRTAIKARYQHNKNFDALWGSLLVKDLSNNKHVTCWTDDNQAVKGTDIDDNKHHAEMRLLDELERKARHGEIGLPSAKIIVSVGWSPCTKCSAMLRTRTWEIAKLLGKGKGFYEFSFVYQNLFVPPAANSSHRFRFESVTKAEQYYGDSVDASRIDGGLTRLLLVRPYSKTKDKYNTEHESFKDVFSDSFGG